MNRVVLIGRLTANPELRYTSSNIAYSRFTVAINSGFKNEDGEQRTDFINCVAWKSQAENIAKYMKKGNRVAVEGRLQTSSYEKQDGSRGYITEVHASNIEFLESKKESQPEPEYTGTVTADEIEQSRNNVDPFADFGDCVTVDDNFLD